MPKLKKGSWTPAEVAKLLNVERDGKQKTKLEKLAAAFKRKYHTTYQKWNTLMAGNEDTAAASSGDKMVFVVDTSITEPSRLEESEINRLRGGLDDAIPKLPVNGGSIPIPNRLSGQARRYLDSAFNENKFTFQRMKEKGKETGFTRIFKRQ